MLGEIWDRFRFPSLEGLGVGSSLLGGVRGGFSELIHADFLRQHDHHLMGVPRRDGFAPLVRFRIVEGVEVLNGALDDAGATEQ